MVCTFCGTATAVINSRHQRRSNSVWRRRKCLGCGRIVSTVEQLDYEKAWTVIHNDMAMPFLRDTFFISVYRSLGHRPAAINDATALTATVISKLLIEAKHGNLTREKIICCTVETLKKFDAAAAVTYAAYHI